MKAAKAACTSAHVHQAAPAAATQIHARACSASDSDFACATHAVNAYTPHAAAKFAGDAAPAATGGADRSFLDDFDLTGNDGSRAFSDTTPAIPGAQKAKKIKKSRLPAPKRIPKGEMTTAGRPAIEYALGAEWLEEVPLAWRGLYQITCIRYGARPVPAAVAAAAKASTAANVVAGPCAGAVSTDGGHPMSHTSFSGADTSGANAAAPVATGVADSGGADTADVDMSSSRFDSALVAAVSAPKAHSKQERTSLLLKHIRDKQADQAGLKSSSKFMGGATASTIPSHASHALGQQHNSKSSSPSEASRSFTGAAVAAPVATAPPASERFATPAERSPHYPAVLRSAHHAVATSASWNDVTLSLSDIAAAAVSIDPIAHLANLHLPPGQLQGLEHASHACGVNSHRVNHSASGTTPLVPPTSIPPRSGGPAASPRTTRKRSLSDVQNDGARPDAERLSAAKSVRNTDALHDEDLPLAARGRAVLKSDNQTLAARGRAVLKGRGRTPPPGPLPHHAHTAPQQQLSPAPTDVTATGRCSTTVSASAPDLACGLPVHSGPEALQLSNIFQGFPVPAAPKYNTTAPAQCPIQSAVASMQPASTQPGPQHPLPPQSSSAQVAAGPIFPTANAQGNASALRHAAGPRSPVWHDTSNVNAHARAATPPHPHALSLLQKPHSHKHPRSSSPLPRSTIPPSFAHHQPPNPQALSSQPVSPHHRWPQPSAHMHGRAAHAHTPPNARSAYIPQQGLHNANPSKQRFDPITAACTPSRLAATGAPVGADMFECASGAPWPHSPCVATGANARAHVPGSSMYADPHRAQATAAAKGTAAQPHAVSNGSLKNQTIQSPVAAAQSLFAHSMHVEYLSPAQPLHPPHCTTSNTSTFPNAADVGRGAAAVPAEGLNVAAGAQHVAQHTQQAFHCSPSMRVWSRTDPQNRKVPRQDSTQHAEHNVASYRNASPCTQPPPRRGGALDDVDAIKDTSSEDESEDEYPGGGSRNGRNHEIAPCLFAQPVKGVPPQQSAQHPVPVPVSAPCKAQQQQAVHAARGEQQIATAAGESDGVCMHASQSQCDSEPGPEVGMAALRGKARGCGLGNPTLTNTSTFPQTTEATVLGEISNTAPPCGRHPAAATIVGAPAAPHSTATAHGASTSVSNQRPIQQDALRSCVATGAQYARGGYRQEGGVSANLHVNNVNVPTGPPKPVAKAPVVCKSKVLLARRGGAKRRGGYEDDENDVLQSIAPKKRAVNAAAAGTLPRAPPPPRPAACKR